MGRWPRHHRSSTHRAPRPHRGWSTGVAILATGLLLAGPLTLAVPGWAVDDDQDDGLSISGARVDDYPEVSVTVNARRGVIDPAAAEDAFVLLENGQERDVAVQRLDSEDLEVALIIDTSGSMEGAPLAAAQQAAQEFVESMPAVVQLSVIEFSTTASLRSDFTDDREETGDALTGLSAGGWTALYDAIELALDLFDDRDSDGQAIVVLTDGGDNRSSTTLDELTERLADGAEVLHLVELITTDRPVPRERFGRDDPDIDEQDLEALRSLASAADQGFVASPTDLDDISAVYADIAASLMNQYELTYTSEAFDEATVEVRLTQDDGEVAGTRVVELPPSPEEPEEPEAPAEEPEEEPIPEEPEPLDEEPAAAVEESSPFADLLDEPWVLWTIVAAIVVGIAFLIFYIRGMPSLRS